MLLIGGCWVLLLGSLTPASTHTAHTFINNNNTHTHGHIPQHLTLKTKEYNKILSYSPIVRRPHRDYRRPLPFLAPTTVMNISSVASQKQSSDIHGMPIVRRPHIDCANRSRKHLVPCIHESGLTLQAAAINRTACLRVHCYTKLSKVPAYTECRLSQSSQRLCE